MGGNKWSTGLCGCFNDCRSCCLTCWCPCVTFGRNAEFVDRGQSICCAKACQFCVFIPLLNHIGLSWIFSMEYRGRIRRQYGIDGNSCCDCLAHYFCQPCALCQEYRELQFQGFEMSAGWDANVAKQSRGVTMAPVGEAMKR